MDNKQMVGGDKIESRIDPHFKEKVIIYSLILKKFHGLIMSQVLLMSVQNICLHQQKLGK